MIPVFFYASSARVYLLALSACLLMLSAQGRSQEPAQTKAKPKPTKVQPSPAKPVDETEPKPTEFQIIPLKSANAVDVAELLRVMLGMKNSEGEEIGGPYVPIAIDRRTNSLIVSAPTDKMDKIRSFVNKLD